MVLPELQNQRQVNLDQRALGRIVHQICLVLVHTVANILGDDARQRTSEPCRDAWMELILRSWKLLFFWIAVNPSSLHLFHDIEVRLIREA